jgi:hypothetical protein
MASKENRETHKYKVEDRPDDFISLHGTLPIIFLIVCILFGTVIQTFVLSPKDSATLQTYLQTPVTPIPTHR